MCAITFGEISQVDITGSACLSLPGQPVLVVAVYPLVVSLSSLILGSVASVDFERA